METVECPDCGGDGKHRGYRHMPCATCHGEKVVSRPLFDTLMTLAGEEEARRKRIKSQVATAEVFGHQTDFEITTRREGDKVVITVDTVLPAMKWDGRNLCTWAPPRYPWITPT